MSSTMSEVLEAARALPREERAEVAEALLATLDIPDNSQQARHAALRDAVDKGIASLDAGRSTLLSVSDLKRYLNELGQQATERAQEKHS